MKTSCFEACYEYNRINVSNQYGRMIGKTNRESKLIKTRTFSRCHCLAIKLVAANCVLSLVMVRGCCDGFNVFATDVIKTQISITDCWTLIDIAACSSILCFSLRSCFWRIKPLNDFVKFIGTKSGPTQKMVSVKVSLQYIIIKGTSHIQYVNPLYSN